MQQQPKPKPGKAWDVRDWLENFSGVVWHVVLVGIPVLYLELHIHKVKVDNAMENVMLMLLTAAILECRSVNRGRGGGNGG